MKNIDRAVKAIVNVQKLLASMSGAERLQVAEATMAELRRSGLVSKFSFTDQDYDKSYDLKAGPISISINCLDYRQTVDGATGRSRSGSRYADLDDDIPF